MKIHTQNRRGSVLLMALVAATVVLILCAGLIGMVHRTNGSQAHVTDTKEAFHVAESGLAEAFTGLTMGRTGNVGTLELPAGFGDGLFWVEARESADGIIELESTGMVGSGRATLELHVRRAESQVGALGMFGDEELIIPDGIFIDGFDSRLGAYSDQVAQGATKGRGRAGSNKNIRMEGAAVKPVVDTVKTTTNNWGSVLGTWGSTTQPLANPSIYVDGEATPGAGAEVLLSGDAKVSGSMTARNAKAELPTLSPPVIAQNGSLSHGDAVPLIVPAGDQSFQAIEIGRGAEVILTGPSTVLVETLMAKTGALLLLDTTGGPVDLIVTEWIEFQPQARLETVSEDSTQSSILVSAVDDPNGPAVKLECTSQFFGSIVAPQATVFLGGDFDFFGAIAARNLTLEAGAQLHFDHALADPSLDGSNRPRVVSWRVVDIPLEVNNRALSPFDVLGVDRSALPSPSDAHEDQLLVIDYVDLTGFSRSYSGWESSFNWNNVKSVDSATRNGTTVTPVALLDATSIAPSLVQGASTVEDATMSDLLFELLGNSPNQGSGSGVDKSWLADVTIKFSPLPDFVKPTLIAYKGFTPADYKRVIEAQGILGDNFVATVIGTGFLSPDLLAPVLLSMSPLGPTSLGLVLDGTAGLTTTQINAIVAAQ